MRDQDDREVQPGEWIAIQAGCKCTVRDGEAIDNDRWPDWLVRGCQVHDEDTVAGGHLPLLAGRR